MKILIHFVSTTGKEGAYFYKETMSIFKYFLTRRCFRLNFIFEVDNFYIESTSWWNCSLPQWI